MDKKLLSTINQYKDITSFSQRAVAVYNPDIMGVKVLFNDLTDDYGLHTHPHTQLTLVVKGSFKFVRDGEKIIVKEGDSLLFEADVEHGCIPLEPYSELYDVFIPIRDSFLLDDKI